MISVLLASLFLHPEEAIDFHSSEHLLLHSVTAGHLASVQSLTDRWESLPEGLYCTMCNSRFCSSRQSQIKIQSLRVCGRIKNNLETVTLIVWNISVTNGVCLNNKCRGQVFLRWMSFTKLMATHKMCYIKCIVLPYIWSINTVLQSASFSKRRRREVLMVMQHIHRQMYFPLSEAATRW